NGTVLSASGESSPALGQQPDFDGVSHPFSGVVCSRGDACSGACICAIRIDLQRATAAPAGRRAGRSVLAAPPPYYPSGRDTPPTQPLPAPMSLPPSSRPGANI